MIITLTCFSSFKQRSRHIGWQKWVSFVNNGQNHKNGGSRTHKTIKCFICGIEVHYVNQCTKASKDDGENSKGMAICTTIVKSPSEPKTTDTNGFPAFSFSQSKNGIPYQWILLDNQSMTYLFCIPELLANINESPASMKVNCNAGLQRHNPRTQTWNLHHVCIYCIQCVVVIASLIRGSSWERC